MPYHRMSCPSCGRVTAVEDKSGRMARHNADGRKCPVSGLLPDVWAKNTPDQLPRRERTDPFADTGPADVVAMLSNWWRATAEAEIEMVVGKAIEYGATDLRDLGLQILEMAGQRRRQVLDEEATEIGIAFYAAGKLARIMAAVKEGRRPSLDTWIDLGVYARMAQRVHSHHGWPAAQTLTARYPTTHWPVDPDPVAPAQVEKLLEGLKGI